MNGAPCLLQSTLIATWFAWCCACSVLHGWLQCAASALLHSYAHVHTHYTHMYAVCTNVIFRLCTPHLSVQGPVGTNGKTLTHSLFLQACRLHSWKQAQMGENKHVNAHIITYTCPIQMDMHVCTHLLIWLYVWCLTNCIARKDFGWFDCKIQKQSQGKNCGCGK